MELIDALMLLRDHRYIRAANRLERLSQDILSPNPERKAPKKITVHRIQTASGKKLKLHRALTVAKDRVEEKPKGQR
jgi:hypothetical protein